MDTKLLHLWFDMRYPFSGVRGFDSSPAATLPRDAVSRIETTAAAADACKAAAANTDTHSDMFRRLSTEEPFVDKDRRRRSYREMSEAFTALDTTTNADDLPRRVSYRRRLPTLRTSLRVIKILSLKVKSMHGLKRAAAERRAGLLDETHRARLLYSFPGWRKLARNT